MATKKRVIVKDEADQIKRVVIYIRMSRNRDHSTTLETQELQCRRYCEMRGWEVVKVLKDPGRSAFKRVNRPEFDQAITMVTSKQVDAVVVFKVDRFTRSIKQFMDTWQEIRDASGHFVSVMETFDTSNTMGQMMLMLVAGFAQMESEMKSDRAIPMHEHQKENGKVGPGPRPYGYDRVNSRATTFNPKGNDGKGAQLVINPKEADLIRTAATWVLQGGSLAGFIHKYQPRSSMAKKEMTVRGLRHTLTNPTTAGGRFMGDTFISKGEWEPILDEETWLAVRALLMDPSRRTADSNQLGNLLSGMMKCRKCGKGATARNWTHHRSKAKSRRYQCPKCGTSVDLAAIDQVATEALFEAVPQSKWESWQTSGMGWDESIIEGIQAKLAAADKAFSDPKGNMTEQRWLTITGDLNEQLDAAMTNEPLDIPKVPNLQEAWPTMSLPDKQRVFRQAFHIIELLPMNGSADPATRISLD